MNALKFFFLCVAAQFLIFSCLSTGGTAAVEDEKPPVAEAPAPAQEAEAAEEVAAAEDAADAEEKPVVVAVVSSEDFEYPQEVLEIRDAALKLRDDCVKIGADQTNALSWELAGTAFQNADSASHGGQVEQALNGYNQAAEIYQNLFNDALSAMRQDLAEKRAAIEEKIARCKETNCADEEPREFDIGFVLYSAACNAMDSEDFDVIALTEKFDEAESHFDIVLASGAKKSAQKAKSDNAESERLARESKADVATADMFSRAEALRDEANANFENALYEDAAQNYVNSSELFAEAQRLTDEKREAAENAMKSATAKTEEARKYALDADAVLPVENPDELGYVSSDFESQPQSYVYNEYQLSADEFLQKTQSAFDGGDFDAASGFAAEAESNAAQSIDFVHGKIIKTVAQNNIATAKERLDWAKSIDGEKNFPMTFESASASVAQAESDFSSEKYDDANDSALSAIEQISTMSEVTPLPQYYVVRPWAETRDCYWTISGRPYVYNNPTLWENLYQANKSQMRNPNNPNLIYPAMRMFIPSISGEKREGDYDPSKRYTPFENK